MNGRILGLEKLVHTLVRMKDTGQIIIIKYIHYGTAVLKELEEHRGKCINLCLA